jgi:hypothetical protein
MPGHATENYSDRLRCIRNEFEMTVGRASPIVDGTVGCDITQPLNQESAAQYYNSSFRFIIRYIGRGDGSANYTDLTEFEADTIITAGLALGVIQHPLGSGWMPSQELGTQFGAAAAAAAAAAGLPAGVTVWLDLEGVAEGAAAQDVIAYCNAWFEQVESLGYVSGIYIGASPGISADQLYWNLHTKSYWKGGSSAGSGVPDEIPNRGYQLIQQIENPGTDDAFDRDVVRTDNFGNQVIWCMT